MSASSLLRPTLTLFAVALLAARSPAADAEQRSHCPGDLAEIQKFTDERLAGVGSVALSPDGRYLYAAAPQGSTVASFGRDPDSGRVTLLSAMTNPALNGAAAVRVSDDGKYAVASAFIAGSMTLFRRNKESGSMEVRNIFGQGERDLGLQFLVDAVFSKDSRFLYTASTNGVGVFALENDSIVPRKLEFAEGELSVLRSVVLRPDGKYLFTVGSKSRNVAVFRVNPATGDLKLTNIVWDETRGFKGLRGAFCVACSPDSRHVYINSGRTGGDDAITVCALGADDRLSLIEQHLENAPEMEGFKGGSGIAVSPDGHYVFALASLSDRLFRFERDSDSGALTFVGSQPVGGPEVPGCAALCFSPDGRFVYVADENSSSLVVLKMP